MTTKMDFTIGSISDRENLVASLWYNNVLWCEISQEESTPVLEMYPHPTGKPWTFPFEEALVCLQHAARKLLGMDAPVPQPTMTTQMEIKIASLPDRENLVAEVWDDKVQWCEISQEESDPILEIYPHPTGKFPFAEAFACPQHAARKLVGPDEPVPEPSSFVVKQVAQKAANPDVRAE